MDLVEKILVYLDVAGVAFASAAAMIHATGLDQTRAGKAIRSVSIDIVGLIKALRSKPKEIPLAL